MEKHLLNILVLYITTILVLLVNAGRPPPIVNLSKCCRIGEYLDQKQQCVAGSSLKWVPTVLMIAKKAVFEPLGEAPRFFRVKENSLPQTCTNRELFIGSHNIIVFSNGSLFLSEKSIFIDNDDYCVDKDAALVCFPTINGIDSLLAPKKLTKIKKCCAKNFIYEKDNKTCGFYDFSKYDTKKNLLINSSSTNIEITYGFPQCSDFALAGPFKTEYLHEETGYLTLESGKKISSNDYCLERTLGIELDGNHIKNENIVNMFVCAEHFSKNSDDLSIASTATNDNNNQYIKSFLITTGLIISIIFLMATMVTGYLMPSNHHVLHWKCQMYYISCLLVGDILLVSTQLTGSSIQGTAPCVVIAISMHFFFLAAFFWLNIMCINIWWTFRDFRPSSLEKNQEILRLRFYNAYAWGGPIIIASVAAISDLIPPDSKYSYFGPKFERRCWFYGDMEILAYFFGPVGFLLCLNLLLFASTARQLTCGLWKLDDVKSTTENFKPKHSRAALGRVCLKLVIVMGITWVADIISWLVGGPIYVWAFTDLINALHGFFIFIVVGCQPQVWAAIKRIWSSKTGIPENRNGPQHSSSSHGLPSIGETVTHNTLTNTTTSTKVPMETVC